MELARFVRVKELEHTQRHGVCKEVAPNEAKGRKVKSRWVCKTKIRLKHGAK